NFTYSFEIPSPLDADNCVLVAFVQSDQDRQILQGVKVGIPDLNSTTDLVPHPETPSNFHLGQNYPNPFNSETSISFHTATGFVELAVFDITGSLVNSIFEGVLDGGSYSMVWDGKDRLGLPVSSGIYYYRVTNGNRSMVKKMTLLK
ncbi:MAG: T9SS type A sorting domain-containing protein, partial [Candidatus Hodarchaeales archaeon]